jgi:uncharacterized repeat protein (TIGR02543 family)
MKNSKKTSTIALIGIVLLITACENPPNTESGEKPITFTVTFDSQGGSVIAEISGIEKNTLIVAPKDPTKDGDLFGGWYRDKLGQSKWNFTSDTVTESITLYAKWNFELLGEYQLVTGSVNFKIVYSNNDCTISADYPNKIQGYDNSTSKAVLYWTENGTYSKITWVKKSNSIYFVSHYSEKSSFDLANTDSEVKSTYYLVKKYVNDPTVVSYNQTNKDYIDISFSHIMDRKTSSYTLAYGAIDSTINPIWSDNYVDGTSTMRLTFSNPIPSGATNSIVINPTGNIKMKDVSGNYVMENTIVAIKIDESI